MTCAAWIDLLVDGLVMPLAVLLLASGGIRMRARVRALEIRARFLENSFSEVSQAYAQLAKLVLLQKHDELVLLQKREPPT